MGGATSNLTSDQSSEVTKELRLLVDKFKDEKLTDDEMLKKLTAAYNAKVQGFIAKFDQPKSATIEKTTNQTLQSATPAAIKVPSRRPSKETLQKSGNQNEHSTPNSTSRRRSFDSRKDPKVRDSTRRRSFAKQTGQPMAAQIRESAASNAGGKKTDQNSGRVSARAKGGASSGGTITGRVRSFDGKASNDSALEVDNANASDNPSLTSLSTMPIEESNATSSIDNAAATATAAAKATETIADSWDSVTQQPYCNACHMAFKSIAFLERHVKYSDLHAKTLQKIADEAEVVKNGGRVIHAPNHATQVEGEHYKLLYSGTKLYWRTQDTVDINIYHHILPHTIEVIAFDHTKYREINRLYFELITLDAIVDKIIDNAKKSGGGKTSAGTGSLQTNSIRSASFDNAGGYQVGSTDGSNDNLASRRLASSSQTSSRAELEQLGVELHRSTMVSFILERLQMEKASSASASLPSPTTAASAANNESNKSDKVEMIVQFHKLPSDTFTKSPLLEKIPLVLFPVCVVRRRRTNAEEIDATISNLTRDRAALAVATGKAEKIANLVYAGANAISNKKWWADLNPVRKLWIWAIRRVIRQKLVAETKLVLAAKADAIAAALASHHHK